MHFDYGLTQIQTLRLNLTPEMKQSIQILQYASFELVEFLQNEATENPLLELDWTAADGSLFRYARRTRGGRTDDEEQALYRIADLDETLESASSLQLRCLSLPDRLSRIARYIIGNLDDNGYLVCGAEEIGRACGAQSVEVSQALAIVQSLEPAGIGARTLQECLLLQIRTDETAHPLAETIVSECWEWLAGGKRKRIAAKLGVGPEELHEALESIRRYDPRPGSVFTSSPPEYVFPDALVKVEQDGLRVEVCDAGFPRVAITEDFRGWLGRGCDEGVRQYMKERLLSAKWLIRALEQRETTLRRVIEAIVEEQEPYFRLGGAHLKPMSLKTIAVKLGIHESTVSRAAQNKYVLSPQGLAPLKSFFSNGVVSTDGAASASQVKLTIKRLIEAEDKRNPLSDQRIAELLLESGIRISRRTVVKYREELHLLSSRLRQSC